MHHLTLTAPAKINLSLDVVGRRADGYHLLSTVMQSISLHDVIELMIDQDGTPAGLISLSCDKQGVPPDERNTAYQAARRFLAHAKISPYVHDKTHVMIRIHKAIPVAGGLAGGSSDAAAVLSGLGHCFPGVLTQADMQEIAMQIGADVPFCLTGGTVLCEGIGEKLSPLPPWPGLPVLLCNPGQPLLTARVFTAYRNLQARPAEFQPDTSAVLQAIARQDLQALARHAGNVLTPPALQLLPEIGRMLQLLQQSGAVLAQMSGSGPSVFGLFAFPQQCSDAAARIKEACPGHQVITCLTQAAGPQLVR